MSKKQENPVYCSNIKPYNATYVPQKPQTSFKGATRLVMNTLEKPRPFLPAHSFLEILAPFKSKIVGQLPKEFLDFFPNNPKQVFEFFDKFSQLVQTYGFRGKTDIRLKLHSGKIINIEYIGAGNFGKVFKIDTANKSFAFKSFEPLSQNNPYFLVHGVVAESRTNLYLRDRDYKDYAKFHIANLDENNRWSISDFIDETYKKPKNSMKIKGAHPEIYLGDSFKKENYVKTRNAKIRIDAGGITHKYPKPIHMCQYYKKNAFYARLRHKHPKVRKGLAYQLQWLLIDIRKDAFYTLLNHNDPEVRKGLAYQIEFLPRDVQKDAFYALLNHKDPEVRKGLAMQIAYLREGNDIKDAFYALLNHKDPEVRKGLATQIAYLRERNDIKHAFYTLLNHNDPEVRKGLAYQIEWLPKDAQKDAFYALLNHNDPEVRKGLAYQIEWLPIDSKKDFFYAMLNHKDPKAKEELAYQIRCLHEKDEQKDAFYAVLNHPDVPVDLNMIKLIKKLFPNEERPELINKVLERISATCKIFNLEKFDGD